MYPAGKAVQLVLFQSTCCEELCNFSWQSMKDPLEVSPTCSKTGTLKSLELAGTVFRYNGAAMLDKTSNRSCQQLKKICFESLGWTTAVRPDLVW